MKTKNHNSQKEDVLEYLKNHESLSQMQAYRVFDAPITRLAVAICSLRKQGYDIETVPITGKNCYGTFNCCKYVLKK